MVDEDIQVTGGGRRCCRKIGREWLHSNLWKQYTHDRGDYTDIATNGHNTPGAEAVLSPHTCLHNRRTRK